MSRKFGLVFFLSVLIATCIAQTDTIAPRLPLLKHPSEFNKTRFWSLAIGGAAGYSGLTYGLNELWYKQYPRTSFHFFNDLGEWEDMDKVGHTYSAYNESSLTFHSALWTGMDRRDAMWTAAGIGTLFQLTIEMMDAYSEKWGFSGYDIGFNTIGVALFVGQELAWQEQRMVMKVSSYRNAYSDNLVYSEDGNSSTRLNRRADDLFGHSMAQILLKDYNAQTLWLSANVSSFLSNDQSKFPKWLNIAVGYGAENMFGGFDNSWEEDGTRYVLDDPAFQRRRQYYLSFDIDLNRLNIKNRWLQSIARVLNIVKIPSPTLELDSNGTFKFHPLFF